MPVQKDWDEYEVALLIEAYFEIKKEVQSKKEVLIALSENLRKRAKNLGYKIDDEFRNLNGMVWQESYIDKAFKSNRNDSRAPSALFHKMTEMYKQKPEEFKNYLQTAKDQITGGHSTDLTKQEIPSFSDWLTNRYGNKFSAQAIIVALDEAGQYAIKKKLSKVNLAEIDDPNVFLGVLSEMLKNKFFQITHGRITKMLDEGALLYKLYLEEKKKITEKNNSSSLQEEKREEQQAARINDDLLASLEKTIDYLKTRFDVRLHYDSYSDPGSKSNYKLYKVSNSSRDVMWVYFMGSSGSRYISIETKPEYLASIKGILQGFSSTINRDSPQGQKMMFSDFNTIENALISICDSIDAFFPGAANFQKESQESVVSNSTINSEFSTSDIESLLKTTAFQHGIRLESLRGLKRFRLAAEEEQIKLPDDDEALKQLLLSCGMLIDDKLFAKREDMEDELKVKIEAIFASGVAIIYYESLFYAEQEWMERNHILSEEILKDVLKQKLLDYNYTKLFFTKDEKKTEPDALSEELKRVWGENAVAEIGLLSKYLPFIPYEKIQKVLFGTKNFVWVSEGKYLLVDRIMISEEEAADILEYVERAYKEQGFASLTDIPLGSIPYNNTFASGNALLTAIYNRLLKDKYRNNGKILTNGNSSLNIVSLLSKEFRDRDEVTFDEVNDRVVELNGGSKRQHTFKVLYYGFVRISEDKFVASKKVHFDVEETDRVLSDVFRDGFGAIRDVTTFAMFPVCGVTWNHYVLESYCFRYSQKFYLSILNFNSTNVGIIAERKRNYSYYQMLAIALANSSVNLNQTDAVKYLFQRGMIGTSKYSKLGEIISEAEKIKKEKR